MGKIRLAIESRSRNLWLVIFASKMVELVSVRAFNDQKEVTAKSLTGLRKTSASVPLYFVLPPSRAIHILPGHFAFLCFISLAHSPSGKEAPDDVY
jgi:hypothetical protein